MKINDIRNTLPTASVVAITEAAHQPEHGGGRIYDAIKRNVGMISAEEKQDIISLLQSTGGTAAAVPVRQAKQVKAEPIMIGGNRLDPNNPADAKIIAQLRSRGAIAESQGTCPKCGGPAFTDLMLAEKQDACYHKVRSRYKVWPSAYASGALVQCRKKGAANWGTGGKKE